MHESQYYCFLRSFYALPNIEVFSCFHPESVIFLKVLNIAFLIRYIGVVLPPKPDFIWARVPRTQNQEILSGLVPPLGEIKFRIFNRAQY